MEDQTTNYVLVFIMLFGVVMGCGAVTFVCFLLTAIFGLSLGG